MIALTLAELAEAVAGQLHLPRTECGERTDLRQHADQQDCSGTVTTASTTVDGEVTTDSREVTPGGIFVAKPGECDDGHRFAPDAAAAGAALLIVERLLDLPLPQIVVTDSVVALGAFAAEVVRRVRARGRLRVIGVTGSNGKTTTKNLLRDILCEVGPTVAARKSFNNEVGVPLTMLEVTWETEFLVLEMGASRTGDIARLIRLVIPDIGIVLKVGLAHAGEFGGIEQTVRAKAEMVTDLCASGVAVLNGDDPRVAAMAELTPARVVQFGLGRGTEVRATDVTVHSRGTDFTLTVAGEAGVRVRFGVLGEHHIMNALAATAAARCLEVPVATIVAALERVTLAERWRMQVLGGRGNITIINDAYNASPDSMAAALKTLAQIRHPEGRAIAVLGEMSELGEYAGDEHDQIGLLAVRLNIAQLVVVGHSARRVHLSAIKEGSWDGESHFVETPAAALSFLRDSLHDHDTVLVKSSNSAGLRFLGDELGEWLS